MIFSSIRSKSYKNKVSPARPPVASTDNRPGASSAASASADDVVLDGVEVAEYARGNGLTESQVWQRIRRGELAGRVVAGRYLLYTDVPQVASGEPVRQGGESRATGAVMGSDAQPWRVDLGGLLDGVDGHQPMRSVMTHSDTRSIAYPEVIGPEIENLPAIGKTSHSPELMMLIEHLSLARQENRDILRLTEESIRRITTMSESIVAAKESQLTDRNDQIQRLQEQLDDRDRSVIRLQQHVEDLEMLTRSLE